VSAEFQVGLEDALEIALATANPSEKILLSSKIPINYIYFLFFRAVDPESFQKKSVYIFQGDAYRVRKFGRFYFDDQYIYKDLEKTFVYIYRSSDLVICKAISSQKTNFWTISRCMK
jgi:hypothetical protein